MVCFIVHYVGIYIGLDLFDYVSLMFFSGRKEVMVFV